MPRISVLLPVFNGAQYLQAAIESVLKQSYSNFELLILNDGSTDSSGKIAQDFEDSRIRYFEHPNMGLAATLNEGARHARGEFLFRQDQDDLSRPTRFEHQVEFFDKNPQVSLVGTWARIFADNDAIPERFHRHPTTHAAISLCALFDSPFVHSSAAMRRSAFEALGGYSCAPSRQPPEDFELWSRMCRAYQAANLSEVLLDYREVPGSMSRTLKKDFIDRMVRISEENLHYWLADSPFEKQAGQLGRIYHLYGAATVSGTNWTALDQALGVLNTRMTKALSRVDDEYRNNFSRIRNVLMRNFWLARLSHPVIQPFVKGFFRLLRAMHG